MVQARDLGGVHRLSLFTARSFEASRIGGSKQMGAPLSHSPATAGGGFLPSHGRLRFGDPRRANSRNRFHLTTQTPNETIARDQTRLPRAPKFSCACWQDDFSDAPFATNASSTCTPKAPVPRRSSERDGHADVFSVYWRRAPEEAREVRPSRTS